MVLIRFLDEIDPTAFVPKLFEHLTQEIKKPRTRYSNRILPIEKTCFVSEDKIIETIAPAVERVFREMNPPKRPFKFRVDLKVRNNNVINKDELKRKLAALVGRGHFVDLKSPDKVLIVEVFAKAAGVAVIDNAPMETYKGYNIRRVSETFGEPLPPFPDELKKANRQKQLTPSIITTPAKTDLDADGGDHPVDASEVLAKEAAQEAHEDEDDDDDEDDGEVHATTATTATTTTTVSEERGYDDSDSDSGGISLF